MNNRQKQIARCNAILNDTSISRIIGTTKECKGTTVKPLNESYITEKYRLNDWRFNPEDKLKINAILQLLEMSV